MTIIAWDGKTLAADSLTTSGVIRWELKNKIYQLPKENYYTYAGDIEDGEAVYNWLLKQGDKPENLDDEFCAMYTINKKMHVVWSALVPYKAPKINALGVGSDVAYGVMHHGGTSVEAVRIVCKLVEGCGGRVNSVEI